MRPLETINLSGTYGKGVLLSAPLVLTFLILTVFAVTTNLNAANAGDNVEVVRAWGEGADLVDIPNGTQILRPSACPMVTQEVLDANYHGSADEYDAAQIPEAECLAGHMQATVLSEKINDVALALQYVYSRINRLEQTIDYLKLFSATNLNNLSLFAVPAGDRSKLASHTRADNIFMKCLIYSPPRSWLGSQAVGTQVNYTDKVFNPLPPEALKALKTLIDDNNRLKEIIKSGLTMSILHPIKTLETIGKLKEMAGLTYKNQLLTAKYFIPVVLLEGGEKNYSSISIEYILDNKGNKQIKKFSSTERKAVKDEFPDLPETGTTARLSGKIILNGKIDNIIYNKFSDVNYVSPLPDAFVFNLLNKSIDEHMGEYQRLKSEMQTEYQNLQGQLDALRTDNYHCIYW